jgi:N-acetylmuramoyl-L-alanine amidase
MWRWGFMYFVREQLTRQQRLVVAFSLSMVAILVFQVSILPPSDVNAAPAVRRTLYWGTSGSDVRLLQSKLQQWGYYKGSVDGIYGRLTYQAIRLFQQRNGLRVDGLVGRSTYEALGIPYTTGAAAPAPAGAATTATRGVTRSNDERLLAQLVRAEAEAEPYTGMVAVAAVVLNRVRSSRFPNTVAGVVYQPGAFESVGNGRVNLAARTEHVRAARDALNGWDPSYGSLFFWNPAKPVSAWIWSRTIKVRIGKHVFAI